MEPAGLSSDEVRERKARGLANDYEDQPSRGYLEIVARNLLTPFNLLLFVLAAALYVVNEDRFTGVANALSACGVVLFNVLISTFQEIRAKRRLDRIAVLMRPRVTVRRDGEDSVVDKSEIVVGDLVSMSAGDQAQVDGKVVSERSAEMDESLLTGESSTVRKHAGDPVYSGSYCVAGEVLFEVEKVGAETFSAGMMSSARRFEKKRTPLQVETNAVTFMLMLIAGAFLLILVAKKLIFGTGTAEMLGQAVVILDIVPIALFLLITLTYMIAAVRMADSGALLQDSGSVESMSHVDTVCMDKTGTITTNNLVFEEVRYFGDRERTDRLIRDFLGGTGSRNRTVTAMEARFGTGEALLLDEVQFSSDRKYSAVRVEDGGEALTAVMGAWPYIRGAAEPCDGVEEALSEMSSRGLRTVVFCDAGSAPLHEGEEAVLPPLRVAAAVAIRDEVRPDCRDIINEFASNGMDVKVISGDSPDTVAAIFDLAGIPGERSAVSGPELESMSGEEYSETVRRANIFGRMRPEQKEEVISELRRQGRYVAYVGDGVNDVRSIKRANVGVSVQSGSGAARGVADIVLMNDDFSALPRAIVEGKRTVSGMRDILRLYLSRNFTIAFLVVALLLALSVTPLLPVQNTVYALVTVSFAAFLLTFWAKPSENRGLILPRVMRYVLPVALCTALFALAIYAGTYLLCESGAVDMAGIVEGIRSEMYDAGMWSDPEWSFWNTYAAPGSEHDLSNVFALNAMFLFLLVSGVTQLFLLFPPSKRLSYDGKVVRDPKILLLAALLYGVIVLLYSVPQVCEGVAGLIPFEWEWWAAITALTLVWLAATVVALRWRRMDRIESWTDGRIRERVRRESGADGGKDR